MPGDQVQYTSVGLGSGNLKFENSFLKYSEDDWQEQMSYLKVKHLDLLQSKPSYSDNLNNYANNTFGENPYPDILAYWNFYHTDELDTTDWVLHSQIDHEIMKDKIATAIANPSNEFDCNEERISFFDKPEGIKWNQC